MHRAVIALTLPFTLLACSNGEQANAGRAANSAEAPAAMAITPVDGPPFQKAVVATFDSPWAMTFLPDASMLVTEKAGVMKWVSADGKLQAPIAGVPKVDSEDQGGLMDVVPDPAFVTNGRIYFSYSATGKSGKTDEKGVVLARARLVREGEGAPRLEKVETLFRAQPLVDGGGHYSGRIAFSPDHQYLFFTAGERQKFDPAQDPKSTLGKVLRLTLDGKAAKDNPLAEKGFDPAVWSYGHRNLLGIAFDAQGRLWEQEMGPKGGDEINLIKPGLNYGYPKVSNGDHYDGQPIPDHAPGDGFEAPKLFWNPSISPAGLIYYSGEMFPQWKGSLFLGGLSGKVLIRIALDGEDARKADQWDMGARIRDVKQGPDGSLYLLEDGPDGKMLKLTPPRR